MRRCRALLAVLPLLALGAAAAPPRCVRVYIGGAGIVTAVLDTRDGRLTALQPAFEAPRITWLLADAPNHLLYAITDPRGTAGEPAAILSFRVDPPTGLLTSIASAPPGGTGATHLALDRRSDTLFAAMYGSGQASALMARRDGTMTPPIAIVQNAGTGPTSRQTFPHAHAVVLDPSRHWLLVPDLGADRIFVHRFDRASRGLQAARIPFLQMPAGSGPRHLVFARDGRHAFLVSELAGTVSTLGWDARTGRLALVQTLPLDPPTRTGFGSTAEIALSADGRTLYVSNRQDDTIAAFAVDPRTGALREEARVASGGRVPRSFAIDPSGRWMVVANQGSDTVAVLPVGGTIGGVTASATVAKPVTIAFAGGLAQCPVAR